MLDALILRHGQSEWNAAGRWQGQADPPLSDLGIAQAREAAGVVGAFDAVVSSDLDRAATTARIIAEASGLGPVVIDDGLRERDVGEWQSLTREEIERRWPGHLANGSRPPGWEPNEAILARAMASLHRIAEHVGSGEVLVVAHGGIIYALEGHLGADFARIDNLHGRWFRLDGSQLRLGERIALVANDGQAPDL